MTSMARGCFIQLLCHSWENDGLPEDPRNIARLSGLTDRDCYQVAAWKSHEDKADLSDLPNYGTASTFVDEIWPQLECLFDLDANGRWRNPKIEEQRSSISSQMAGSKKGGIESAKKRLKEGHQGGSSKLTLARAGPRALASDLEPDIEKKRTSSVRKRTGEYPTVFELWWDHYPKRNDKRVGKKAALRRWKQLDEEDRVQFQHAVKHYARSKIARVDGMAKDPERFLKDDYWRDWLDGPGDDEHVEERDRRREPEPVADAGGPPVDPSVVTDELGHGSLTEAVRGLGEAFSMEEKSAPEDDE